MDVDVYKYTYFGKGRFTLPVENLFLQSNPILYRLFWSFIANFGFQIEKKFQDVKYIQHFLKAIFGLCVSQKGSLKTP